ncbi:MAG: hypothetical protein LC620_03640, partial [Halobacteriales archaeon]|nr:hypothetical protein [Halobacteriales archaeon]
TDNCPDVPNVDQADRDGDGTGDACQLHGEGAARVGAGGPPLPPSRDGLTLGAAASAANPAVGLGSAALLVAAALLVLAVAARRRRRDE